jgi:biofilm PGA synthesis N-glycosyltransferase PgaC
MKSPLAREMKTEDASDGPVPNEHEADHPDIVEAASPGDSGNSDAPFPRRPGLYVPVRYKLLLAIVAAAVWVTGSVYLSLPWIADLSRSMSPLLAWLVVSGIALVPGLANSFLLAGLALDRRPRYEQERPLPPVSILVAAYNEESSIGMTIETLEKQDYDGSVEIIVIDDGSRDKTISIVEESMDKYPNDGSKHLRLLRMPRNGGKANALNAGFKAASHDLIVTVDGDSFMRQGSLAAIVRHMVDGPPNTAAVAGTVLVRNSRTNLLTRLQEWDYFHGIAVVKRIQSLFQGTLVAQGAFSIYRRDTLEEVGGWPDTLGEDIVLTWGILCKGHRVSYAENAFVFTNVPESYGQFYRQRKRWSRGLIEAFKKYPQILLKPRLNLPFVYLNVLFPFLDMAFLFGFLPGVIAAVFFHNYAIVGVLTVVLLPLALLVNLFMFHNQRRIFRLYGLKVRKNIMGLIWYMIIYQMLMSPASVAGYLSELFMVRKKWDTK